MEPGNPLIHGRLLDGRGGCTPLSIEEADALTEGVTWLHLDLHAPETRQWLYERSGLDPAVTDAMTADSTRPRCLEHGDGMLVILRGVNLNPGADPEDMISIRIWLEERRIVSVQLRKLRTTTEVLDALEKGDGPATAGEFLARFLTLLTRKMDTVITELDETLDGLEDNLPQEDGTGPGSRPWELRREVTALRRYIIPQAETLTVIMESLLPLLSDRDRLAVTETHDRTTRFIEELSAMKERALILHEEVAALLSARMNRHAYYLTILAGLFLPLGFLTGLLGINVGGIPLAESPYGFLTICLLLVAVLVIEFIILKRKKWL